MLNLRHHSKRALNDKLVLNMQQNAGISVPYHSSVCIKNKTAKHHNVPYKVKRLKTIKQRNQIRSQNSNRFNLYCEEASKKKRQCSDYQDCQCSCLTHFSRKAKPVSKPFPALKSSIITEHRLTSIRGLFSHEVRSVDIERLVKVKKGQTHIEQEKGRHTTASNSSTSCVVPYSTPPVVISETSEEGISACSNKDQKTLTTDHLQINLEDTVPVTMHSDNHSSIQTPNTARFACPPNQYVVQEAVIMPSSEIHPVQESFPTSLKISQGDHKGSPTNKNIQKKTNNITAAVGVNNDFGNSERLVTPTELEALELDLPQLDLSATIFLYSSPTLDDEKNVKGKESEHRKPVFSSKEEAVSRLAARLCDTLDPFPIQRRCPLLTDCREVLLHHLQKQHGPKFQHSLRKKPSQLSARVPHFSQTAEQDWPGMMQKYSDNTLMSLGYTRIHEDNQLKNTVYFQTDNSPQKHCLPEVFCKNVEGGGASMRQRKQTQGLYSPQEFVTRLQQPCQDTLSQWTITAQITKQYSKPQTFSPHQDFSKSQTSPWSYRLGQILEPFCPQPQKGVKAASSENRTRNSTELPLLEQWRNDPDLDFLFQEETLLKTQISVGHSADLRNLFPNHGSKRMSDRHLIGASSSVSSFFPPEGFCYKPYYQFPHPSNSFNQSENLK